MDSRATEDALRDSGHPASATLWRTACAALEGEICVVLLGLDDGPAYRALREWALSQPDGVRVVVVEVDAEAPVDEGMPLAVEEALLSAHALVWATPVQAPLGQQERAWLEALTPPVAPTQRGLWLADQDLLNQLSDDPKAELSAIEGRLEGQLAAGWTRLRRDALESWLHQLRARRAERVEERTAQVAAVLLDAAAERETTRLESLSQELARFDALLGGEAEALDAAFVEGERVAARVRAAVEHHTDALISRLHAFARQIEAALPTELETMESNDALRRVLPHWLEYVFAEHMSGELARCRADVLRELAETGVGDDAEVALSELLAPALSAHTVQVDGQWSRRLGVTAAVGGGAALLVAGLWIPGAIAVSSGLVWGAWAGAKGDELRAALLAKAVDAVRSMAADAERQLLDQLDQLARELEVAPSHRREAVAERRAAQRERLVAQQRHHTALIEQSEGRRRALLAARDALPAAGSA